jgi:hypothetical protein
MPNRWAVQNGNWSNTATWNSGATLLLPTASDDVFANNFNVTIDQPNITVNSLNTSATTGVSAGGTFISTNGISIALSRLPYGINGTGANTAGLTITGSDTVYFLGNVQGSPSTNVGAIRITNGGTLYFTGSTIGGLGGSNTAPGIYVINGNIFFSGSIFGGNSNNNAGIIIQNGTINSNGIIDGTNGVPAIIMAGSSSLTHNGSVRSTNGVGISSTSTGNIIITGSVAGGVSAGISSTSTQLIIVTGSIISSPAAPGISSTSTSTTVRVSGPLINQNNINAVYSPRIQWISSSATYYDIQSETFNQDVILYDPAYPITFPPTSSVRSGSLYGATNQLTGSMIVPSPSDVRYGVPVDNTTGSATLTPQDVFDFATQNLTGSNTIGARLQNISTVQTTAATIAAFKGK